MAALGIEFAVELLAAACCGERRGGTSEAIILTIFIYYRLNLNYLSDELRTRHIVVDNEDK